MSEPLLMFEDFTPRRTFTSAERQISGEEIVKFAKEFDPQPMHVDEAAGKASILGGLSASGWHTSSLAMRLVYDSLLNRTASEGSPGVDLMEWRKPLLAGDTIKLEVEVKSGRPLHSKPGLGLIHVEQRLINQKGQLVMRIECPIMVRMRSEENPR